MKLSPLSLLVSAALAASAAASLAAPPTRAEAPADTRWNFNAIYPSWEAWEAGMTELQKRSDDFTQLRGTLKSGPDAVLKAYQQQDEIGKLLRRLYAYTSLQRDVDTRDQAVSGRFQRVSAAFARLNTAQAWFTPELLAVPEATMTQWLAQTPALAPYRFGILDEYRSKRHVLDEKGERLLSLAQPLNQAPTTIYQELSTSDIQFPTIKTSDGTEVKLTPGAYGGLLERNPNQADRAKAAAAHVSTYGANANTYAAIYGGLMQRDWFIAQARNFPTTLDAALDNNNVPRAVVDNLIAATRAGVAPLQRYMRLRQKLLGLSSYHPYDSAVPIYRSAQTYPFEKARDLALASVAPLGPEYVAKYKQFLSSGHIDVYEGPGKRSGAYVSPIYGVGPYMLLNHNETLNSAFTFAHEAGHAMHTVLSHETQPYATAYYTIFVAEVASTTNERFLLNHLLQQTTDPKERFLLLQHAVDNIVGTFYTQVMFADYELQAHQLIEQGKPVTTEALNGLYAGLLKQYYGDAVTVDDFYKWTWARIPHFYNSPYYVYQYATCFASSAQLFKAMTTGSAQEQKAATERYLTLLKAGGNDHPMAQLKKAGVDLTQRATMQAVIDQMDTLVSQLEAEAARIAK